MYSKGKIVLKRLPILFNAIYHGDTQRLIETGDRYLNTLYLRHLIRKYEWSNGSYDGSNSEEDVEVKDTLAKYMHNRYGSC